MDRKPRPKILERFFSRLTGARLEVILLAVSTAIALPIRAQDSQPSPSPQVLKVSSDLVLVDVVITDKKGQHVRGLRQGEFTVLEDGNPRKIATFSLEDTATLPEIRNVKSLPKGLYTNRPEYRVPPGPVTILLLDELNTPWSDQAYMRAQILDFLKSKLRPGERMAILGLGASLHVLQDFTDDPEILRAAVEGYNPQESTQLMIADVQSRLPASSRMAATPAVENAMAARVGSLKEFYDHQAEVMTSNRAEITLKAMRSLGKTLAGFSGRKILIWLSAGFPLLLPNTGGSYSGGSFTRLLRETTEVLTNARIAVYPVDVRGLVGATVFDARNGAAPEGQSFASAVTAQLDAFLAPAGTMKDIASWTGGTAFIGRNDLDRAVEQSIEDGSCYYVLGYYRTDKTQDGKFHKIEVRLDQPGLHARYRRGYYAVEPSKAPEPGAIPEIGGTGYVDLVSAMKPDAPLQTQILIDARLSQIEIASRPHLSIDLRVDPSSLASEQAPGGKSIYSVTVHVAVYRSDGRLEAHKDWSVRTTTRDSSNALQNGLPLTLQFQLRPGSYHVRIAVRDTASGRLGTVDDYSTSGRYTD